MEPILDGAPPPRTRARGQRWLAWVFLSSLALRAFVAWSWQRSPMASCLGTDPQSFYASAWAIAAGGLPPAAGTHFNRGTAPAPTPGR